MKLRLLIFVSGSEHVHIMKLFCQNSTWNFQLILSTVEIEKRYSSFDTIFLDIINITYVSFRYVTMIDICIYCEMITIILVNIYHHIYCSYKTFFLVVNAFKISQQLSNVQCSINYIHYAVHCILPSKY